MASSSSSSHDSDSDSGREMTLEFDLQASYEVLAPPHWDLEEFDFWAAWSEDDASDTEGEEDLRFLVDGELEEEDPSDYSWEGDDSSSEGEKGNSSSEAAPSADDGDNSADDDGDDDDGSDSSFGDGDDEDNDDSSDDSNDIGEAPPLKCRKHHGVYWW